MRDANPAVEQQYHTMLMQKSGEERLRMGCSMFMAAKAIVESSIKEKRPDISLVNLKEEIFLRFYGHELSEEQKLKIRQALKRDG